MAVWAGVLQFGVQRVWHYGELCNFRLRRLEFQKYISLGLLLRISMYLQELIQVTIQIGSTFYVGNQIWTLELPKNQILRKRKIKTSRLGTFFPRRILT